MNTLKVRGNENHWELKWEEMYKPNRIGRGIETIKNTLATNQTDPQSRKIRSCPEVVRFDIRQPLVVPQTSDASPMLELSASCGWRIFGHSKSYLVPFERSKSI